jgi:hypothetical protein
VDGNLQDLLNEVCNSEEFLYANELHVISAYG